MPANPHPENQPDDLNFQTRKWLETRIFTQCRERRFLKKSEEAIGQSELEWAMYNEILRLRKQIDQLLAPHYKPDPFDSDSDKLCLGCNQETDVCDCATCLKCKLPYPEEKCRYIKKDRGWICYNCDGETNS